MIRVRIATKVPLLKYLELLNLNRARIESSCCTTVLMDSRDNLGLVLEPDLPQPKPNPIKAARTTTKNKPDFMSID